VQVAGTLGARAVDLKYSASVVNGRGRIPDEVTSIQDRNDGKAVNLLLGVAPNGVAGLELGANAYLDTIPPDPDTPGREGDIREVILGGYAVYVRPSIELLAEVSHVAHRDRATGVEFGTWGLYGQGSWKLGPWRPYYRFDKVDIADGDPFLAPKDLARHTAGLRFDPMPWVGLKGEYRRTGHQRTRVRSPSLIEPRDLSASSTFTRRFCPMAAPSGW
jgi:hypothetical protein